MDIISVPFAIFAAQTVTRHGFEEVIREVIAAGGDTDTNASMAGQIAGAYLGNDKLPRHLRNKIPYREHIAAVAHQLAALGDQYR